MGNDDLARLGSNPFDDPASLYCVLVVAAAAAVGPGTRLRGAAPFGVDSDEQPALNPNLRGDERS